MTVDAAGRYHASFVVEVPDSPLPSSIAGGGDRPGADAFRGAVGRAEGRRAAVSRGRPRRSCARAQKELARAPARLERTGRSPGARSRACHVRVGDTRRDWLHKLSTTVVRENQSDRGGRPRRLGSGAHTSGPLGARRRLVDVRRHAGVQGAAGPAAALVEGGPVALPSTQTCSVIAARLRRAPSSSHVRTWTSRTTRPSTSGTINRSFARDSRLDEPRHRPLDADFRRTSRVRHEQLLKQAPAGSSPPVPR